MYFTTAFSPSLADDLFQLLEIHNYTLLNHSLNYGRILNTLCRVIFLNPQKIFSSKAQWKNDDISFQACVSARSKEGVGGDALGMESAAFFCGASSMLTGAWYIPLEGANKFFMLFLQILAQQKVEQGSSISKSHA